MAALTFSFDTLKTGGHFLCKFYQGSEEKAFETKLKRLFAKVHREKPDSSRTVCSSQVDPVNSILTLTRSLKRRIL
jgi:23S rRNA U2552 (ribose-2'-O)-methylase RlmE/FtsJ